MLQTITKLASLRNFYFFCGKLLPWFAWPTLIMMVVGLYWGLVEAPADYQQKDSYRIIYIHVPAAWMSLFVYLVMASSAAASLSGSSLWICCGEITSLISVMRRSSVRWVIGRAQRCGTGAA